MQKRHPQKIQNYINSFQIHKKDLTDLQNKISLNSFQMLELTLNKQKFAERIQDFNEKAFFLIQSGHLEEALIYLGQAEKLLQYAAGRGYPLDRQVIIRILNNKAVVYQKLWDHQKCVSYIEGIIFHLGSFIELEQNKKVVRQIGMNLQQAENFYTQKEEIRKFIENNYKNIKNLIQKKFTLSLYLLQFSIINSQNQQHQIAIEYSLKAVQSYQDTIELCHNFNKLSKIILRQNYDNSKLQRIINLIRTFKNSQYQELKNTILIYEAIQRKFQQKSNVSTSFQFILQKYASLEKKDSLYKNFSLNNILELSILSFRTIILKDENEYDYINQIKMLFNQNFLSFKVLQYVGALFTLGSQIQENINSSFLMSMLFQEEKTQKFYQKQYLAQKYHLFSLKISIEIVEQLTPLAKHIFKKYQQTYRRNLKKSSDSFKKIQNLQEKYKQFIDQRNSISNKDRGSSEQVPDKTIQQYNISQRHSLKSKEKESLLQKLLKENPVKLPQDFMPEPPHLKIDLSEVQSVEFLNSKTIKRKSDQQNKIQIQEQKKQQQPKHYKNLTVPSVTLLVPNLSDIQSNKNSEISCQNRSTSSKKDFQIKKYPSKNQNLKSITNKIKSVSSPSKNKISFRNFLSPKNHINKQKTFKKSISQNNQINFTQRKHITSNQKNSDKRTKTKPIKIPQKVKKNKQYSTTPQQSHRNVSIKSYNLKFLSKDTSSKKFIQLKKAKSFDQIKRQIDQTKDYDLRSKEISQRYNLRKQEVQRKEKLNAESRKTKSTQNLKFQSSNKDFFKSNARKNRNQIKISCKNGEKRLYELKNYQKNKKSSKIDVVNQNKLTGWKEKAIRMSSFSNLMHNQKKQTIKKTKSSQSIHASKKTQSEYFLKGLKINSSQRTKSGSLISESLRNK